MPRLDNKRYERQVALAMAVYVAVLLGVWPLLHVAHGLLPKTLLALAPVVPLLYVIVLMGRRICASDELEQRTHLVALGVSTALVSGLSTIGGFLAMGGVLHVDGSVLFGVFPVLLLGYALTRKWVARRYGVESLCAEEGSTWLPAYFAATGLLMACLALYAGWQHAGRDAMSFVVVAVIFAVLAWWARWRQLRARRRMREE